MMNVFKTEVNFEKKRSQKLLKIKRNKGRRRTNQLDKLMNERVNPIHERISERECEWENKWEKDELIYE